MPYSDWLLFQANNSSKPPFIIKKFAGKVKEICSILTDIPVEDFEKQEVKDRVLGEEWNQYEVHLAANAERGYNSTKIFVSEDDAIDFIDIHPHYKKHGCVINPVSITVRQLLQQVGTDAMRNVIHENVWVNALFADYKPQHPILSEAKNGWDGVHCICCGKETEDFTMFICKSCLNTANYPNWIITDTRFPNEAKAIKSRGGLLIRVNRGWIDLNAMNEAFKRNQSPLYNPNFIKDHPSETSLDNYPHDEVIDNNGTIEELIEKVKLILIKYKIL